MKCRKLKSNFAKIKPKNPLHLNKAKFLMLPSIFTVNYLSLSIFLSSDCGKRPPFRKRRVIGGHEAKAHSWPWQAEIQAKRDGKWYHKCGASLINPQWIVTAAHCLTIHADRKMRIVLGL